MKEMRSFPSPPGLEAWRALYPGMWAWILQRVAGVLLLVVLPLHIIYPYVRWVRLLALALVLWHAMHGVKVLLTDLGFPARFQRGLLWALAGLGLVLFIYFGVRYV